MPYYRLTTPSYFGGLPATHDAVGINNLSGPGTPSPVSIPPVAGTYQGTRFEVPLESAEATKVNRANEALSENCDFIDDILHSSHPTIVKKDNTAGGGGDTFADLSDDVFVGRTGVTVTQLERDRLIVLVKQSSFEPILDASGVVIFINDLQVTGGGANVIGSEATGYHSAPRAVFSTTVPAATSYRLLYCTRSTVAIEQQPSNASGGMGYLAQAVLEASRRSQGSEIPFTSGLSTWADSSSLTSLKVQAAIDEVVDKLGLNTTGNGGTKVGLPARTAWLGGRTNVASDVRAGIDKIITDLAVTTPGDDGGERIGASTYVGVGTTLPTGSVRSQLDWLADKMGALAASNTWSGALNTFGGTTVTMSGTTINLSGTNLNLNATNIAVNSSLDMATASILWDPDDIGGVAIGQSRRIGTGANFGRDASFWAQPGQNQTGGADNENGGWLNFTVGGGGSGGSGALGVSGATEFSFPNDSGSVNWTVRRYCIQDMTVTGVSSSDTEEFPMGNGEVVKATIVGIIDENGGAAYRIIEFKGLIKRFSGTTTMSPSGGAQTGHDAGANSWGDALSEALFIVSTSANGFTVGASNGGSGLTTVLTAHIHLQRVAGW